MLDDDDDRIIEILKNISSFPLVGRAWVPFQLSRAAPGDGLTLSIRKLLLLTIMSNLLLPQPRFGASHANPKCHKCLSCKIRATQWIEIKSAINAVF